ncbi:MAG: TraC family protein [bacterium]|nr:TraC family protein [bacterium]
MSLLRKSHHKTSSRQQIGIKEVRDGILVLPKNKHCAIVETSSINFELKSEAEQDVLIENFQNFLNALPCSLQIVVRIREVDIEHYLHSVTQKASLEQEPIYKEQATYYTEFIQKLIVGNKILSRRFYIIIPYQPARSSEFNLIKEQVLLYQDIIIKGFEKMGMKAKPLDSMEVLDLFYSFYNPELSKLQELKAQTVQSLFSQSYDI